ncbi:MAG TPA: hypothetical protein VMV12_00680 [Candidatus Micrarchaeaceae archaeon]|nr:hypothetical protein [Candidatus Micrarchaeaceae archaeon]
MAGRLAGRCGTIVLVNQLRRSQLNPLPESVGGLPLSRSVPPRERALPNGLLRRMSGLPPPRSREVKESLIRPLHRFSRATRITD